jgi:hypothetical protein
MRTHVLIFFVKKTMEKEIKNKNCPSCGKEFECFHNVDCWCTKYTISDDNSKYLALHYNDCLCEQCLLKFVELDTDTKL